MRPVVTKKYLLIALSLATISAVGAASASEVARDVAIHDCSVMASKYSFSTWQTTQFAVYGTCMAEHDQEQ
jgi:hypothetical protein